MRRGPTTAATRRLYASRVVSWTESRIKQVFSSLQMTCHENRFRPPFMERTKSDGHQSPLGFNRRTQVYAKNEPLRGILSEAAAEPRTANQGVSVVIWIPVVAVSSRQTKRPHHRENNQSGDNGNGIFHGHFPRRQLRNRPTGFTKVGRCCIVVLN